MNSEICFSSAFQLASAVRKKQISPVEITQAVLDRIERLNPRLNAFCTMMIDEATEAARLAEEQVMRGESLGLLHGVPVSVKDNLYIKGVRTTFGSKLLENEVTDADAPSIERLKQAGAILIGRTNSPEFGWKGVCDNLVFGTTRNPWDLDLTPGGSSGGASAAVASGLGPIGMGTDGGGSLRIPASFCGLVGHKASFGRVPTWPGVSVGDLRHIGGITRTVTDSALLLNVIAGPDERDHGSLPTDDIDYVADLDRGIADLRIAYSGDLGYATTNDEVARACASAAASLADAGAKVDNVELDWQDPHACWSVFFYGASGARLGGELEQHGHLLDPGLRKCVEQAVKMTAVDLTDAMTEREAFWQRVRELFESYDLLITPTLAVPPFPINQDNADSLTGEAQGELQWTQFTYPFNLTGQPACSVPAGWTNGGLPIGIQMIGPRFGDAVVLRAARALEQIQPWEDSWPSLALSE
jgi:aspartyl-tRNA(Asn)/glutamyl-tRNA(Gln) amidotransferase subunit A